jgi:hypothetical protein
MRDRLPRLRGQRSDKAARQRSNSPAEHFAPKAEMCDSCERPKNFPAGNGCKQPEWHKNDPPYSGPVVPRQNSIRMDLTPM